MKITYLHVTVMAATLAGANAGYAQSYPIKPIRYIVPFAPSGTGDVCARFHAQGLQERFGQPVVVENRAGASQAIGIEAGVKSAPDGYTLVQGTGSGLVLSTVFAELAGKTLPYDPVKDLAPVSMVCTAPLYLAINAGLPATNIKELVELARSRPGKLTYASNGTGSTMHLGMLLFAVRMNVDLLHVPYKASAQATTDLVSGVVDMFLSGSLLLPHARSGKLRVLASAGQQRTRATPEVPTMVEAGVPGYDMTSWFAVMVPAGTPPAIVRRLQQDGPAHRTPTKSPMSNLPRARLSRWRSASTRNSRYGGRCFAPRGSNLNSDEYRLPQQSGDRSAPPPGRA
jgi:tripartite-type tricarboxylate transporter receptor subunit TctC